MHFTMHLTTACQMRCSYCYAHPCDSADMSRSTLEKAILFAHGIAPRDDKGIIFFGGEPLLRKDLIQYGVDFCNRLRQKENSLFHFKVTTNGLLLDSEFLQFASTCRMTVAMSVDGAPKAHDTHRKRKNGISTFESIDEKITMLLEYQPYAPVLMVVTPETVASYTDSVDYLLKRGFKYLIISLNYSGNWTDKTISILKKQYHRLASLYERHTVAEKKFYLSPFEVKLATRIMGEKTHCQRCVLAQRQVSIGPDGTIFPCVQFVKDCTSTREFAIGSVDTGFDEEKRNRIHQLSQNLPDACGDCALALRCNHTCSCLNWATTGSINQVADVVCQTEQILIPIVDQLGSRLYRKKAPAFIQKHYNPAYPLISLMEDLNYTV